MWRKYRLNKRNIFSYISNSAVTHQEARKEVDFPSAACRDYVHTFLRLLNDEYKIKGWSLGDFILSGGKLLSTQTAREQAVFLGRHWGNTSLGFVLRREKT